jgi:hypothetical protein
VALILDCSPGTIKYIQRLLRQPHDPAGRRLPALLTARGPHRPRSHRRHAEAPQRHARPSQSGQRVVPCLVAGNPRGHRNRSDHLHRSGPLNLPVFIGHHRMRIPDMKYISMIPKSRHVSLSGWQRTRLIAGSS